MDLQTMMTFKHCEGGYKLFLKDRPYKTPLKNEIILKNQALADLLCAHKDLVRIYNTALDHGDEKRSVFKEKLCSKIHTDLVCYRASHPDSLVSLQQQVWDPVIDLFNDTYHVSLNPGEGVLPIAQSLETETFIRNVINSFDAVTLVLLQEATALYDSVILALLLWGQKMDGESVWQAATLEEAYLMDTWGQDAELQAALASRKAYHDKIIAYLKACF